MSDIVLKCEYKGYEIEWFDHGFLIIRMDGTELRRGIKSLEDCQAWIDRKTKEVFERVPVLFEASTGWNQIGFPTPHTVTSVIDDSSVWVVSVDGKRSKEYISSIWADTKANRELALQIKALKNSIIEAQKEIREIEKKAEIFTIK